MAKKLPFSFPARVLLLARAAVLTGGMAALFSLTAMLKFTKPQLDALGTLCGLIAGVCGVLTVQEVGNPKVIGTVGGVATVVLGYVVQHPAKKRPTTEDVEPPPEPPQRPTTLY